MYCKRLLTPAAMAKNQFLACLVFLCLVAGSSPRLVYGSEDAPKVIDLTKIDSGFFVSKREMDGLRDTGFRERLEVFLKDKGIPTRSAKGHIFYYISENQIEQIEEPEFREKVRRFVSGPEQRPALPQRAPYRVHEVQPGDTIWNISKRYGMPIDVILRLNKLSANDSIYPGQKLLVDPDWNR